MELTGQQQTALGMLEMLIRQGRSVEEAQQTLALLTSDPELVSLVVERRKQIAAAALNVAEQTAIYDPEDIPAPWYTGPQPEDVFWPALKALLEADPGWRDAVPSLDQSSTDIVGLLAEPHSPSIRTRGLVLGYVQSGKTANFTATIAKAADAGYRLFIVLSGVHNALRRQTQLRLDEQLYELNKTRWLQLTDEPRDFGNPVKALALVAGTDLRILAVVKKNVSRLTRLSKWLQVAHAEGGLDTCPVLIIDDESDQASPNTAKDPELDRTKVNQRIVELLQLPRVAYLGYTATPFANVLVNPGDVADIYPRTFIYSLPKPASYFGSEELFGSSVSEEEETEDDTGHDMIRIVPDSEAGTYKIKKGVSGGSTVTPALKEAIRWFLMATAARRARTGVPKHSSMLIHTTDRVAPQLDFIPSIQSSVKALASSWDSGDVGPWRVQWEAEQEREPSSRHGLTPVSWDEMASQLPSVLSDVRVLADNSKSTERLIYTDEPATVIAVGGNTLSRGLTLEGLVSSFFLRTASTYDSLLQMGRWFGYRPGYGDLPRIWTTLDLAEDFRFLAEIESDLRREVDRYREDKARPSDLPVRIRTHPKMQVTAKNKMHFAIPGDASYSGQRPQTTYFQHRDRRTIDNNWAAARLLLGGGTFDPTATDGGSRLVVRDVAVADVIEFVRTFKFHPDTELRSDLLEKYIGTQTKAGGLLSWNVAVITRRGTAPTVNLGSVGDVNLITRSKLDNGSTTETANIGTLMSRPDRVADLVAATETDAMTETELLDMRTASQRGLILLYPIDRDSKPKPSATLRSELAAIDHLIGLAFAFPRALPGTVAQSTVMADLGRIQLDEPTEPVEQASEPLEQYEDVEGDRNDVDLTDV